MPEEASESLDPIVELQALELARLLRDNNRLNQRIDFLIGEIKWLRELQERELVLRESEQAMHRAAQDTIKGLTATSDGKAPARTETGGARDLQTHRDQAATDMILAESLAGFAAHPPDPDRAPAATPEEPADEPALPAFLTAGADATAAPMAASDPTVPETAWDDGATAPSDPPDAAPAKRFGLWSRRPGRNRAGAQNPAVSGGD